MSRIEQKLMSGWEFAFGESEPKIYKPVHLPHDWAVNMPFNKEMEEGASQGYRDRFGIGWYRRILNIDEKKSGYCYFLDFGGIFENSTIWINGYEAGGRKYGYSSFRLDVTKYLHAGENQILIKVDNTAHPADRWYSGAGIYRTVKLVITEEKHFNKEDIIIFSSISGSNASVTVHTGIKGRITAEMAGQSVESFDGKVCFELKNARFWSAEEPNLYTLTLNLLDDDKITDTVSFRVGIREIIIDSKNGMKVNGKSVVLKGVCLHQDVGCRGIAAKKEIWRERLLLLKEAGCNAIRAAHHVYAEEFLDLCDEIGFYVYEECFDKWTGGLYGRYFQTEWQKDIEAMVKRDRNHPCIFIWGVGNEVENQGQNSMLQILKMFSDYVRMLDSTRPVSCAMNPNFKRESNVDISKIKDIQKFVDEAESTDITKIDEKVDRIRKIAEYVDVISCNYMEQWYPQIHAAIPEKPILGTEIYQFFKGHHDSYKNFTNENPSLVPFEKDKNYVIGGMVWSGYDYLGESTGYPAKGWGGSLIRTNGEKRSSFYILQSYWSEKPMVHFSVLDYSLADEGVKEHWDMPIYADHWHFPQFHNAIIPYMIASNCDEVILYLNGRRFYLPKPYECPNRVITGFLPWEPGTVEAIGCKDGVEVCRHVLRTPGPAVKLEFDKNEIHIPFEEGYELLLTVRAKDIKGTPYFRESSLVRFHIEGDAEIIGVDSGNLMSSELYNENFIHMYHGCASVQIRLNGKSERVAVWAHAEGMQSGQAIICAI